MWCLRLVGVSIVSVLIWLKTVPKNVIVADVKLVIFVNIFSCCESTLLPLYLRILGIMSVLIERKMIIETVVLLYVFGFGCVLFFVFWLWQRVAYLAAFVDYIRCKAKHR